MTVNIANETYIFLSMCIFGFFIGLIFDCFRILRYFIKMNTWATFLSDLFFWVIFTVTFTLILYQVNNYKFRLYEFFGIILGTILYFMLLSNIVINVVKKIIEILCKIIMIILKIILTPIRFLYKILLVPILNLVKKLNVFLIKKINYLKVYVYKRKKTKHEHIKSNRAIKKKYKNNIYNKILQKKQ